MISESKSPLEPGYEDFAALLQSATAGSSEALESLVQMCEPQLMRVIRRRLAPRLRPVMDSVDVRQAIWTSMIANPERFQRFASADNLIAFVSRVAVNKITDQARHEFGRNGTRDRTSADDLNPLPASDPTPSQNFVAVETRDQLVGDSDELAAKICRLRLQEVPIEEIVRQTGLPRRQVYRVLERIRKRVVEQGDHSHA